jgi:predicted MFS family arabinose efflux permease
MAADSGPAPRTLAFPGDGKTRLVISLAAGWFLILGMRFVIPAVMPTISDTYRIDNASAGMAITVLWITYALMQFPAGALVDRIGERRLLVGATVISGGALLGYWVSPVFWLFLIATAVFGLGNGIYGPSRGTVLSRSFEAREARAFGIVMAGGSLGAAGLPAVAAYATSLVGWRTALAGAAPWFLLVAAALWLTVPPRAETTASRSIRADVLTGVRALRQPRVALAVAGATLMLFGFQAVTAFLTTYLVDLRGFSQPVAGAVLSLVFVVGAASQTGTGVLADRYARPEVLTVVTAISVIPLLALPMVSGKVALAVVAAAIGLRMCAGPLSNAIIIDGLPDDVSGTAWGAIRTRFFVVGSFGSTVVGTMADMGLFAEAFTLIAALTAVAAVVYAALIHVS